MPEWETIQIAQSYIRRMNGNRPAPVAENLGGTVGRTFDGNGFVDIEFGFVCTGGKLERIRRLGRALPSLKLSCADTLMTAAKAVWTMLPSSNTVWHVAIWNDGLCVRVIISLFQTALACRMINRCGNRYFWCYSKAVWRWLSFCDHIGRQTTLL